MRTFTNSPGRGLRPLAEMYTNPSISGASAWLRPTTDATFDTPAGSEVAEETWLNIGQHRATEGWQARPELQRETMKTGRKAIGICPKSANLGQQ